jgi:hypothetical protein
MIDIAKCNGHGCNRKEKCYRYTSKCDEIQSYFQPIPEFCEYFIDNIGKDNERNERKNHREHERKKSRMPNISTDEVKDFL